ncbi:MAG: hypothetical protein ACOCXQ_00830 [Patescibacteria group bacterium]
MSEHIDIAELLVRRAGNRLGDAYRYFWEEAGTHHNEFEHRSIREKEAQACIETILLFQAGMEAMINEEINTNKALIKVRRERESLQKRLKDISFKNKWEQSYSALGVSDSGLYLEKYLEFYRRYRIPITHPKNRYFDITEYRFPTVYHGMYVGWMAFMALSTTWEEEARKDSWEQFCEECNLPSDFSSHRSG